MKFTPMKAVDTRVYMPNTISGFDVRNCVAPQALAEFIVTACNAHDELVAIARAHLLMLDEEISRELSAGAVFMDAEMARRDKLRDLLTKLETAR